MENALALAQSIGPWKLAVMPVGATLLHWVLHLAIRNQMPPRMSDRTIWAGITSGIAISWIYSFWDTLPWGLVGTSFLKLDMSHLTSFGHFVTLYTIMTGAMYLYYLLTYATSKNGTLSFLVRKSVGPMFLLSAMLSGSGKPSEIIIVVGWLLRYGAVDVVMDLQSLRNVLYDSAAPGTHIAAHAFKILAMFAWTRIWYEATHVHMFIRMVIWVTVLLIDANPFSL